MSTIQVDFSKKLGKVKPMHAVNNGPSGSIVRGGFENFTHFKNAGIPYVRNHDASFHPGYGGAGEHVVDVHRIFKTFDADVNDPASYVFSPTDIYLKNVEGVGAKNFYRLGAAIEHGYKYGVYPPRDYLKWAQICEHIIMHYTEGWADGFFMDIEYWEIWNEPDCGIKDGTKPCWQGSLDEFLNFFVISFKYLKSKFPHLKIGGPAFVGMSNDQFINDFFARLKKENIVLDFVSFHKYSNEPAGIREAIEKAYGYLLKYGMAGSSELILNEWNYVRGWKNEDWMYTVKTEKGIKGAAFNGAVMCVGQNSPLDMLMYYDARPCLMNGMFNTDYLYPLKGYYPFSMFNKLYKLGTSCLSSCDNSSIYTVAATDGNGNTAIIISCFTEDDSDLNERTAELDIMNGSQKYNVYLLDDRNDCTPVGTCPNNGGLNISPNTVILLES